MREKYTPPPKNGVQKYYFDLKYNACLIFFSEKLRLNGLFLWFEKPTIVKFKYQITHHK